MSTFRLQRNHPTFLVWVEQGKLVTDGLWWRTARQGEEFIRVIDIVPPNKELAHWVYRLKSMPLYVEDDNGELVLYREAGDPMLCFRADLLLGGTEFEAILLDHTQIVIE